MVISRSALDHTLKATTSPKVSDPVRAFMVIPRSALDHTLKATKSPEVSDPVCISGYTTKRAGSHSKSHKKSGGFRPCVH